MITKNKIKKIKDRCRSKYLISQDVIFTWLCLLIFFIKITLLFNQMVIEIDTHIKLIVWIKRKKIYHARLHVSGILSENKYFLF
jgi:hypothetical protein